ncbi:hypothetical protein SAMN05216188_1011051 [Lentzea xinjiangensis]|uniref:Uncharacterized protein n=1 Tax=Lentzea xinjiangensis TaxID=402600 RepID=A0A1H9C4G5_9PSEU|nr:hypothetical protein [Lentzea xinjiangensis]SEP96022.1 hypothetical protein SAMN05216188_1011051 [Lentzea xinjiangensis]
MRRPVPLIVLGLTAIAAAVVLGAVVPEDQQLAVLVPCCLLSLAFAWGVGKLGPAWLVLPAFMVVIPGTAVLVGDGHRALMDALGTPETCVVSGVEDVPGPDNPAFAHHLTCPDGAELRIVVPGEQDKRMLPGPATVLRHPVMRPLLAERNDWSAEWVLGVPSAALLLLICATTLRARRVMRQA